MIEGPSIDMDYRPLDYWHPENWPKHVLAGIKGTARRNFVRRLLEEGRLSELQTLAEVQDWILAQDLDPENRELAASIHPSLMGGEYLPPLHPGEVEIARVELASTLRDVISVRARRVGDEIHYSVVDEYPEQHEGGYWLQFRTSTQPLTLRQLVQLMDSADPDPDDPLRGPEKWSGMVYGDLDRHLERPDNRSKYFVTVTSEFYPQLGEYYRRKIEERIRRAERGLPLDALEGPPLWLKEFSENQPADRPDVLLGWEGRQVLVLCRTEKARKWAWERFGVGCEEYLHRDGVAPQRVKELEEALSRHGLTFRARDLRRQNRKWHEEHMEEYVDKAFQRLREAVAEVHRAQAWVPTPKQLREMSLFVTSLKETVRRLAALCGEAAESVERELFGLQEFNGDDEEMRG